MFSFWNRKGNKSPTAGRTTNPVPTLDVPRPVTKTSHRQPSLPLQQETAHPTQAPLEPVVAAVPSPHDAAVSEVHAKLHQVEQLSPTARSSGPSSEHPLADASTTPKPPPDPLFDPATGFQRGFFEPEAPTGSGDSEQLRDEAWAHLTRIRELQSEIATMHMHMEGIGDGSGSTDVEVDVDIDVDTVPSQEEEEAAKREKEFAKLPGRFKGRSDNINAIMAKLDDLSQAVTSFHALQPPPLNFDSVPNTRETAHPDVPAPPGDHAIPVTSRTRQGLPPAAMYGSRVGPDQNQIAEVLHDSPVSTHTSLQPDVPTRG